MTPAPTNDLRQMITGYWTAQMIYVTAKLGLADLIAASH